jgi:thermitase
VTEDRQWFNVGAVKLPAEERDVAGSVFARNPERFSDVLGADTPDDDTRYPLGSNTAYSAHLTEREAEQFLNASNCRYVEPDQRHENVTGALDPNLPRPLSQRYLQADTAWYPSLTGTGIRIGDIDCGTSAAARATKNVTLINRAVFTSSEPTNEVWPGLDHGCCTMGMAVPYGGQVVDALAVDANNSTTDSWIANAITWCLGQNSQLVNMSLMLAAYSNVVNDALTAAQSQDTAFFIAAGNDGLRQQRWPSSANTYMPYVHAVMSVDMSMNRRSSFSNYGPWQTGMAPGELVFTTTIDGSVVQFGGTSAATPHVVNLAARIMSAGVSAKQAAAALAATVYDVGVTDGQGASLKLYSMQAALRWLNKEPPIVITRPDRPQKPGLPIW